MHLLVPGAYRRAEGYIDFARVPSQCTFWCRVLTDLPRFCCLPIPRRVSMHLLVPGAYRLELTVKYNAAYMSQCTFWCRVLTDRTCCAFRETEVCLNAPSGAGCLPTR